MSVRSSLYREMNRSARRTYKTVVGTVRSLGLESHGGVVGTTSVVVLVVGTGTVPRQSDQDRSEGSICTSSAFYSSAAHVVSS